MSEEEIKRAEGNERLELYFLRLWKESIMEANRASNWQPIDTAPKDGSWILLYGGEPEWIIYGIPHAPPIVSARWDGDAWLMAIAEAGEVGVECNNPTHWMPLPAPPRKDE